MERGWTSEKVGDQVNEYFFFLLGGNMYALTNTVVRIPYYVNQKLNSFGNS